MCRCIVNLGVLSDTPRPYKTYHFDSVAINARHMPSLARAFSTELTTACSPVHVVLEHGDRTVVDTPVHPCERASDLRGLAFPKSSAGKCPCWVGSSQSVMDSRQKSPLSLQAMRQRAIRRAPLSFVKSPAKG